MNWRNTFIIGAIIRLINPSHSGIIVQSSNGSSVTIEPDAFATLAMLLGQSSMNPSLTTSPVAPVYTDPELMTLDYKTNHTFIVVSLGKGRAVRAIAREGSEVTHLQTNSSIKVRRTHWVFTDNQERVYEVL